MQLAYVIVSWLARGKLGEALRGQRQALKFLRQKIATQKPKGPVIWFHVSSAGEFLQAKPVIESLKKEKPNIFIALSFISPSGMRWAKDFTLADFIGYAPIDSRSNIRRWIKLLQPKALVLVKFDVWPNMVLQSQHEGLSTFMISATLTTSSMRNRLGWVRRFFSQVYAGIDHILCVGQKDYELFLQSNPRHPDLRIVGDTRVDSVLNRQALAAEKSLSPQLQALRQAFRLIVVVGSAWPPDEEKILPCWKLMQSQYPDCLLVLAPHEIKHLSQTERRIHAAGLTSLRYSQYLQQEKAALREDILLIDQIGLLADLYRIGDGAFVGAGAGGVHNTMEPAAWGLPVVFGPVYQNAPEAIEMLEAGIFESVPNEMECFKVFEKWLKNSQNAKETGKKARLFLEKSRGVTYKCTQSILQELK